MPRQKPPRPGYVRADTPLRVRGYEVSPEDGDRPTLSILTDDGNVLIEMTEDEMREIGKRLIEMAGNH